MEDFCGNCIRKFHGYHIERQSQLLITRRKLKIRYQRDVVNIQKWTNDSTQMHKRWIHYSDAQVCFAIEHELNKNIINSKIATWFTLYHMFHWISTPLLIKEWLVGHSPQWATTFERHFQCCPIDKDIAFVSWQLLVSLWKWWVSAVCECWQFWHLKSTNTVAKAACQSPKWATMSNFWTSSEKWISGAWILKYYTLNQQRLCHCDHVIPFFSDRSFLQQSTNNNEWQPSTSKNSHI